MPRIARSKCQCLTDVLCYAQTQACFQNICSLCVTHLLELMLDGLGELECVSISVVTHLILHLPWGQHPMPQQQRYAPPDAANTSGGEGQYRPPMLRWASGGRWITPVLGWWLGRTDYSCIGVEKGRARRMQLDVFGEVVVNLGYWGEYVILGRGGSNKNTVFVWPWLAVCSKSVERLSLIIT